METRVRLLPSAEVVAQGNWFTAVVISEQATNSAMRNMVCLGMLTTLELTDQIAFPSASYVRHT